MANDITGHGFTGGDDRLGEILSSASKLKVGVIGDFALDVYHFLDDSRSEISVETGLPTHAVRSSRWGLGGAGNVTANLAAIGCGEIACLGVVGKDLYGEALTTKLEELGCDCDGIIRQQGWDTQTFTKLIASGRELPRIDHGNFNSLSGKTAEIILDSLQSAFSDLDALVVNQQAMATIQTPSLRAGISRICAAHPETTAVCDSRDFPDEFTNCVHKLNRDEAARVLGFEYAASWNSDDVLGACEQLFSRWGKSIVVTDGDQGSYYSDSGGTGHLPGLLILGRVDPVGAGDSYLAALTVALCSGVGLGEAVRIATLAAGVTVQKLSEAGTASSAEILELSRHESYRFNMEIATRPGRARYHGQTEIELIEEFPRAVDIKFALFDNDGTISTLRQGWEEILHRMMVKAVCGPQSGVLMRDELSSLDKTISDLIARTMGAQTLFQMEQLTHLVREQNRVPQEEILDAHGYKRIYADILMKEVTERRERVSSGLFDMCDFTIKGSVDLLEALAKRGVVMYLASGTDQSDVEYEVDLLGYGLHFDGRVFGAKEHIHHNPKQAALEEIAQRFEPEDSVGVAVFGDGPVEIALARRMGWLAIGVCSDERRRHGLNSEKRARLIEAGAHVIVPHFARWEELLGLISPEKIR